MKKFFYLAVAACAALAACSKNEVTPVDVDQQITFQAVVNKASTKALIDASTYATTNTFGSIAYKDSDKSTYIAKSEVKFYDVNNYWSTATAYYWPINDALTFLSYSPFYFQESGSTTNEVPFTSEYGKLTLSSYDVAAHQDTDIMVADIKKGQKANSSASGSWVKGVPTIFHHKLSQIVAVKFKTIKTDGSSDIHDYANGHTGASGLEYAAGDQQYFINEVSLKNVYFEGSYSYDGSAETASESWTNGATAVADTKWFVEPSGNPNTSGKLIGGELNAIHKNSDGSDNSNGYLLVLPQSFNSDDAVLYIKYTIRSYYKDGETVKYSDEVIESSSKLKEIHADSKWDMNKKITYTISLAKQRIYWDPSVTEWANESVSVQI